MCYNKQKARRISRFWERKQNMNDRILATVGTLSVTESEVNELAAALASRGQNYNTPEGRNAIVEQLINNKLLLLDARKNLYEHTPEFKAQLEKVKEDMLVNFSMAKTLGAVKPVSDADAKEYYEKNQDTFVSGDTVNASHILVDSAEKAQSLLDEIRAGSVSFEDAARKHSTCPSGENGGNLGEFTRGQMVPEFDAAVFTMEEGEIKGPVKTQFGYHLIKLNTKTTSKPLAFEEIKEQIKALLQKEREQQALRSKINQLKILYPVSRPGAQTAHFTL